MNSLKTFTDHSVTNGVARSHNDDNAVQDNLSQTVQFLVAGATGSQLAVSHARPRSRAHFGGFKHLRNLYLKWAKSRERRQTIRTLEALDEKTLRDIGVPRHAILDVVESMQEQGWSESAADDSAQPVEAGCDVITLSAPTAAIEASVCDRHAA